MRTLRLVLADQLSRDIPSLAGLKSPEDMQDNLVLMVEVRAEVTYVKHHKRKVAFLFSAMRHFAEDLRTDGIALDYRQLDDPDNRGSLAGEVARAIASFKADRLLVTAPGEYRLAAEMAGWQELFGIDVEILLDTRFLSGIDEFASWADGRKSLRMEYFYREMRKKYNILMQDDAPIGEQWNYDVENRKPPKDALSIPSPYIGEIDDITQEVMSLVYERFNDHFGDLEPFYFAVTRTDALQVLNQFIEQRLSHFGDYQDAMLQGEPWMYHSHISFYMNCGLLLPLECVQAAERAYHEKKAPLNAVEGFIRQIIGWREYIRGIYWLKMPDYAEANFFETRRSLPDFYWSANTKMNCLRQCVLETKQNAYAHHIQRLMVLGNFALLAGIDPKDVNEWFLIVYADAYEWVELPNVSGMILFADGGYLASKPYAAGGSYINKMSNYCKNCSYKVTKKNGPDACPFNYLYWDFLDRNSEKLRGNHRIGMMYKIFDRMGEEKQKSIRNDSKRFLSNIE